jgi:tyrosyl-tRNA synthetase
MDEWEGSQLNQAKEILAFDLTTLIHGKEEAEKAQAAARALFADGEGAEVPTIVLADEDFSEGKIDLVTMLVKAGLVASRSDARRDIEQGGVTVGEAKVTDTKASYAKEDFSNEGMLVKKGKKKFMKFVL